MHHHARQWLFRGSSVVLGIGLGLTLGWLAIRGTDWGKVGSALRDFPPLLLALAFALVLLSSYLRALRWRLFWTSEKVTTLRLFWVENAALGVNNLSPIRILDEPVQVGILFLRDRLPLASILATTLMCRIQDLAFTILFITVATLTLPSLLHLTPALVPTSLFFIGCLVLLLTLDRFVRRFPRLARLPWVASFVRAVHHIRAQKRRLAAAFGLTCLYWLILGPLGWVIAQGLGLDIPLYPVTVTVLGAIFFATAVPGLPGAIGTFEFAALSLLGLWEVPKEPALSFAIILHTVLQLPSIAIAALVLPREGVKSIKALRELMGSWRMGSTDAATPQETDQHQSQYQG
jgi:uncharacterized protein (TIRG00374 family)